MTRRYFEQYEKGTAGWVLGHGVWMMSQGKNPSEPYLEERNPRKALLKAEEMWKTLDSQKKTTAVVGKLGGIIAKHIRAEEMTDDEARAVLKHIAVTSTSEEEVQRRAGEIGFCAVCTNVLSAISSIGREVRELCLAMGGVTLNNDGKTLIQVMALGVPSRNSIMV